MVGSTMHWAQGVAQHLGLQVSSAPNGYQLSKAKFALELLFLSWDH